MCIHTYIYIYIYTCLPYPPLCAASHMNPEGAKRATSADARFLRLRMGSTSRDVVFTEVARSHGSRTSYGGRRSLRVYGSRTFGAA